MGAGLKVVRMGRARRAITRRREDVMMVASIAHTWICTKGFRLLKPTDDCYPLKAGGGFEEASESNRGGERLAIFTAVEPSSEGGGQHYFQGYRPGFNY